MYLQATLGDVDFITGDYLAGELSLFVDSSQAQLFLFLSMVNIIFRQV